MLFLLKGNDSSYAVRRLTVAQPSSFASRAYRDDGVVLRTHKLGEADRIITILTKHHGQVRAVAKGVRRTSSRFGARLEPFMVVDLQLISGRTLDIVTQAVAKGAYGGNIAADYGRYTVAAAMTETAEKLTDVDGEAGHRPIQPPRRRTGLAEPRRPHAGTHPRFLPAARPRHRRLGAELHRLRPLRGTRAAHRVLGAAWRHGVRRLPPAGIPGTRRGNSPSARSAADGGLGDGGRVRPGAPPRGSRPGGQLPAVASRTCP